MDDPGFFGYFRFERAVADAIRLLAVEVGRMDTSDEESVHVEGQQPYVRKIIFERGSTCGNPVFRDIHGNLQGRFTGNTGLLHFIFVLAGE